MRFSLQNKAKKRPSKGFTLVEILIIAPVVIIVISGLIALMISIVGEVLTSRDQTNMTFETQDALDRIEQDTRLTTQFLTTSGTLFSPQGSDSNFTGTAAFASTNTLILGTLTTDKNPIDTTRQLIYYAGQPNLCGAQQSYNRVFQAKVMYFIKSGSLWRRAALPNYNTNALLDDDTVCSAPWQQNSCSPGYNPVSRCQTNDSEVMRNVDSFSVKYFDTPKSTTDIGPAQALAATTIEVTLNGKKTTAGREFTTSGSVRATKLNNIDVNLPIPYTPTVTSQVDISGPSVTFSWPAVPLASSYAISYNINGGSWINAINNSQTLSYTVNANRADTITMNVYARNSSGSSDPGSAAGAIPGWTACNLQNGWYNYGPGWSMNGYTKTNNHVVMLKGMIAGGAVGTPVCNLPVGFRPTKNLIFQTASADAPSRIDITTGGDVYVLNGNSAWVTLDSINFVATTAPYSWVPLTLANGYTNYGGATYSPMQVSKDALGRVHAQGLIKGPTGFFVAANLPAGHQAPIYYHLPAASNSPFNYFGLGGNIDSKNLNGTDYYSIQAMFYTSAHNANWIDLPTLQGGWVWFGAGYPTPQYTKSSDGIVTVRGLIKSGSMAFDTLLTTLPPGYRPKDRLVIHTSACGQYGRIDVTDSGQIRGMSTNSCWTSLDAINFVAEQ